MCGREYVDTSTWFDTNGYNYSSEIFNTLCNMIRHIWNFLACSTFFFTPTVLKDLLFFVWIRETFLKQIIRHKFDLYFLCTYTCLRNQDCRALIRILKLCVLKTSPTLRQCFFIHCLVSFPLNEEDKQGKSVKIQVQKTEAQTNESVWIFFYYTCVCITWILYLIILLHSRPFSCSSSLWTM